MRSLWLKHYSQMAFVLWLMSLVVSLSALFLAANGEAGEYSGWAFRGYPALLALPTCTVGLVVLRRQPGNAVAWLLMGLGWLSAAQALAQEYAILVLIRFPGVLPGGELAAWILNWLWVPLVGLLAVALILFPDGRLPNRHWRTPIRVILVVALIETTLIAMLPGPLESSFRSLNNPTGLAQLEPVRDMIYLLTNVAVAISFGVAAVAISIRFRRARGIERQQMKWFVFATLLITATAIIGGPADNPILQSTFIAAIAFLPIAMGIAILRYRLYDIDVVIQRTLVYTLLTGLLALVYFGSVVLLQTILGQATGEQPPLVIVLSTLLIAALFTPLRRRVQAAVDRRFYRRKYDAAQTLAAFAQTARDQVELERLTAELLHVVQETMQPAQITVWLKRTGQKSESGTI